MLSLVLTMLVVSDVLDVDFDEDEYEDLDVKIAEFTAVSVVVEVTPLLLIVLFSKRQSINIAHISISSQTSRKL